MTEQTLGWIAPLGASLVVAIVSDWTPVAYQIDGSIYDWMFRLYPPVRWHAAGYGPGV